MPSTPTSPSRRRLGAALAAAGVIVALVTLSGCAPAAPAPQVTVTVQASNPTPDQPARPTPSAPATPAPHTPSTPTTPTTPSGPGGSGGDAISVVASQGPVAPECTHSVCYYVHVAWTNLDPGSHGIQCATDASDPNVWSDNSYNFPTADGERDLKCFLGHPGAKVWVVLDGTVESNQVNWT